MPGEWKEVVQLSFKGDRFRDHALDLSALTELRHFQKLIAETAKALWKAANPNRGRLPARFEERTRLCLRSIKDGSATTPLEVYVDEADLPELFDREPFDDLTNAIDVAFRVYSAVEADLELPEELPKELISDYAKWGESLSVEEEIELKPAGLPGGVRVTRATRDRLAARMQVPYEDIVDITGEVVEADVGQQRFQLLLSGNHRVTVIFNESQENDVTSALKDHRRVNLAVKGKGEFLPGGRLQKILRIDAHQIVLRGPAQFNHDARSIEDELAEIAGEVSSEEWSALPADLTSQLDHYLYGTPKE